MKHRLVVFSLLALVLVAAMLLTLHRSPPVAPPVVIQPTRQQAAQAQRHLEALQQDLQPDEPPLKPIEPGRQKTLLSAPAKKRTLSLSEEDLNVYLASNHAARKLLTARGVKAVQIILLEPANLTIRAAVFVKGHLQNVQLDGGLAPDPKLGIRYTATHAQVGRFPLPPVVVTAQANTIAANLSKQMHGHLPLTIQSVQVRGKMLILTGILAKRKAVKPISPVTLPPALPVHH